MTSEFYFDPVAIGAFHAAEKGILVVQSAGNSGAYGLQSVTSVAPWILSVAASTTDRFLIDKVVLGNGKTLTGFSVNSFNLNRTKVPLVYGMQASTSCNESSARLACLTDCLDKTLVKNKIVVCDKIDGLAEALDAGALGSITLTSYHNISFVVPLPASALSNDDYKSLLSYLNSTKQAEANYKTESIEDSSAPLVAEFSSRGPNNLPDISAPGVDIWLHIPQLLHLQTLEKTEGKLNTTYYQEPPCLALMLLLLLHMLKHFTLTASPMDPSKNPDAEFAYGSGHVNPVKAINPGLVYDNVEGDNARTVTNVGVATSTYNATISSNSNLDVGVIPRILSFKTLGENKSYIVTVKGKALGEKSMASLHL
ncbi:hypothetical protein GQ457_15G029850 [Hibiscus cannabinus]